MNIPTDYPAKPPTVFVGCRTYHVNVNQEDNQIMWNTIQKQHFKPSIRLFQMIIEFIFLLENPESKNYFPTCQENKQMYDIFKSDR